MSTAAIEGTFDVVVVGSGAAGLTGAWLAARDGLETVVVEKTNLLGGTSAYSGGACWLPGNVVTGRAGLPDSTDSARDYLRAILRDGDADRVEAFLDQAPQLVAELEADPGIAFEPIPFPEYFDAPGRVPSGRSIQPVAVRREDLPVEVEALVRPPVERDRLGGPGRRTLTGGQALIARLATMYLRDGGTVRTGLAVTGFEVDGERVSGVVAMGPDGPATFRARRGVLAASGGFEGNTRMRTMHRVPGNAAWTMAPSGTNTGEPIRAALALGAATDFAPGAWLCPGIEQPDGSGSFTLGVRGGFVVDARGERYADECLPYDRFGRAMAAAPERIPSWFVFDAREGDGLPAIAMPEGSRDEHLTAGTRVTAPTLGELARAMGVPADALEATAARFNRFAASGVDEDFGRGEDEYDTFFVPARQGPNPALTAVERPPFHAARLVLSDLGTKGGLVTDAAARVLREDGTVIPGLYAAGNTAASLFGSVYPAPGAPLGSGMVAASLAVRDLLDSGGVRGDGPQV